MSLAIGCVAENTPKYLGQALRLVQSVRWFGGELNKSELYVCVVDDICPDYRKELESYGTTIRIVPRFSAKHPPSNKLRFLELPDIAQDDKILLLDCDTIVVRDPSPYLFHADVTAKIADVPTVSLEIFRQLFSAFHLPMPEATQRCTVSGDATIPYFNAGVLAFTRRAMDAFVPKWIELNEQLIARMELLGDCSNFCEQGSLSLALVATGIKFEAVGNTFNFPMHFDNPTNAPCLADTEPFIIHYHWLADPSGYIMPSSFPTVNRKINGFNARLREERESRFDNRLFWNQRYAENPELGSGVGSRGEALEYKRHLLEELAARWAPGTILDVGCGDLEVGSALSAEGYVGLDSSEVVIATNKERYPDRTFLVGNFLEMQLVPADMVVCLDVLIHLASLDDYRSFVRKLVLSTSKVGIVAGDETDPALGSIVFYHEPISRTLAEAGATNIQKIGKYRHVTIYEFTPPQQPRVRNAVIVLGMHRSGTSALTGVLSLLGIHPGENLMPAMESVNPKGFWEHAEIVSIHEQLLEAFESSWNDETPLPSKWWKSPLATDFRNRIISEIRHEFGELPIWVLKDPRMCRLLPFWHEVFDELGCKAAFIIALRNPAEVAHSLHKRDGLAEEASCLLWLSHMLEAEYQTRGQSRTFVSYEHLLTDWRGTVADMSQALALTWPVTTENAAHNIDAFLDPTLRHHADNVTLPDHPACRLAQEGFSLLSTASPGWVELDKLRDQAEELIALISPWSKPLRCCETQNGKLRTAIDQVERENTELRSEVARVKNSVSWNVTKPLRGLWNTLRSLLPNDSAKR